MVHGPGTGGGATTRRGSRTTREDDIDAVVGKLVHAPVPRCRSVILLLAFWPRICACPGAWAG